MPMAVPDLHTPDHGDHGDRGDHGDHGGHGAQGEKYCSSGRYFANYPGYVRQFCVSCPEGKWSTLPRESHRSADSGGGGSRGGDSGGGGSRDGGRSGGGSGSVGAASASGNASASTSPSSLLHYNPARRLAAATAPSTTALQSNSHFSSRGCHQCSAGSYGFGGSTSAQCVRPCAKGRFSTAGAAGCMPCTTGRYADVTGQVSGL
jgi:hypothetical protein